MIKEKQEQLFQKYQEYESELKQSCPQFVCKNFSHPYYLHIPDEWYDRKCRILIVGQEGYGGNHPFDESIEGAQKFNREYLACQLEQYDKDPPYELNYRSNYWRRVRKIAKLPKLDDFSITWTNIDKIHRIGSRCPLLKKQRRSLHQTQTKILAEEIKLLQPNVVVFCGWYDISLEAELPEVYRKLKKHDVDYPSFWNEHLMKTISEGGISYIFTYHPGWRKKPKGYEEKVLLEVESCIDKTLKKKR